MLGVVLMVGAASASPTILVVSAPATLTGPKACAALAIAEGRSRSSCWRRHQRLAVGCWRLARGAGARPSARAARWLLVIGACVADICARAAASRRKRELPFFVDRRSLGLHHITRFRRQDRFAFTSKRSPSPNIGGVFKLGILRAHTAERAERFGGIAKIRRQPPSSS